MDERVDAMLMRKMADLRTKLGAGNLNPQWVEFMLQRIADGDHAGDLALRPVFLTLHKPKLYEIGKWLDESPRRGDHVGISPNVLERLEGMNWSVGPLEVDLTLATTKNLFLVKAAEKERNVYDGAANQKLRTCPDWVVPALCIWAERHGTTDISKGPSANLCLTSDDPALRFPGFAMWIQKSWSLHERTLGRDISWSGPVQWLLVKPRMQIVA
jgi:hypothetical protein